MDADLAAWQQLLSTQTDRNPSTVAEYVGDVRRFITWIINDLPACRAADVTIGDAKAYRQFLLDAGRAPATINRALISLTLFFDAAGRTSDNPFCRLERVAQVDTAPKALTRSEWNAVRRAAEQAMVRDHGLALAIVSLIRFAGPRVAEVAALQLADVTISPRRGLLTIRRGKGLKHRDVPLIPEARDALQPYLAHRRTLADHWRYKALLAKQPQLTWAAWPDGHCFLGQRGPLTERGLRNIVAAIGVAAKLDDALYHTRCAIRSPPRSLTRRPTESIGHQQRFPLSRRFWGTAI